MYLRSLITSDNGVYRDYTDDVSQSPRHVINSNFLRFSIIPASMYMIQFLTLLFSGLLAGFEIAVHYGLGSPPQSLNEAAQILLRQAMVLRLRILAPVLFLPTLVLGIGLTLQQWHGEATRNHVFALALLGIWVVARIVRTVPVNSATLAWNPDKPPLDWRQLVERTERFHVVAAWAAVLAFVCFLLPAMGYQ